MTAAAYAKAGVLSSRRSGRSINLRGHTEPEDMSILSNVLGVTQEVCLLYMLQSEFDCNI